jgi:hypothetical protein
LLLLARRANIKPRRNAKINAAPPTTPPAIGAMGGFLCAVDGAVVELDVPGEELVLKEVVGVPGLVSWVPELELGSGSSELSKRSGVERIVVQRGVTYV